MYLIKSKNEIKIIHLLIWQTLLSKATYNWEIQQAIYRKMAINMRSACYTRNENGKYKKYKQQQ